MSSPDYYLKKTRPRVHSPASPPKKQQPQNDDLGMFLRKSLTGVLFLFPKSKSKTYLTRGPRDIPKVRPEGHPTQMSQLGNGKHFPSLQPTSLAREILMDEYQALI